MPDGDGVRAGRRGRLVVAVFGFLLGMVCSRGRGRVSRDRGRGRRGMRGTGRAGGTGRAAADGDSGSGRRREARWLGVSLGLSRRAGRESRARPRSGWGVPICAPSLWCASSRARPPARGGPNPPCWLVGGTLMVAGEVAWEPLRTVLGSRPRVEWLGPARSITDLS